MDKNTPITETTIQRSEEAPSKDNYALICKVHELQGKLDICKRLAEGEIFDCADLANDYGGTGWEYDPACRAVGAMAMIFFPLIRATGWQPMSLAPKTGTWVQVLMPDSSILRAHWASDLSGEEQPPFEGWFIQGHNEMRGIEMPVAWRPIVERTNA